MVRRLLFVPSPDVILSPADRIVNVLSRVRVVQKWEGQEQPEQCFEMIRLHIREGIDESQNRNGYSTTSRTCPGEPPDGAEGFTTEAIDYWRQASGLIKSTGIGDELRTPEATLPFIFFFSPV